MSSKQSGRTGSRLVDKSLGIDIEDMPILPSRSSRLVLHGQPLSHQQSLQSIDTALPLRGSAPQSGSMIQPPSPPFESSTLFFDSQEPCELPSLHEMAASHVLSAEALDVVVAYWYALVSIGTAFRLDPYLWVLQDWDTTEETLSVGSYRHVTLLPCSNYDYGITCTCPKWKAVMSCLHQDVFQAHASELQALSQVAPSPTGPAVLVHATPFNDRYIFSCLSSVGRHESGKRIIVSMQRDGRWHCELCCYSDACKHKSHAINFATEAGLVANATGTSSSNDELDDDENSLLIRAASRDDGLGERRSISYLPIPPPRCHFLLDETSRCSCGLTFPEACTLTTQTYVTKEAVMFGLTARTSVTINLLACPVCRHARRHLGPDLSKYGVFNWNNAMLFSHELLNSYTNAYTASETPLSAFCLTVRRAYLDYGDSNTFCSDDTFVHVWFAFTRIQELDSGMMCPTCGLTPDVVIADGISLGTHVSKLTSSIRPPIISSYGARCLPAITVHDLRTTVNKVLVATLVPFGAISLLDEFHHTGRVAPWLQGLCPAFGAVLNSHSYTQTVIPSELRDLAAWLVSRATDVFTHLSKHDASLVLNIEEGNWLATGTCYGLPQVHNRRIYSKLKYDTQAMDHDADQLGDCNKFYKTYSKNNLTGGILVLWCTHSICLGFHSIPIAEG
ncbi:hypothetical protein BU15DRAFT_69113 [Melanogaster broomeanus]|nr:hypothetical protein BU15DRAFT_69113 [Melanogaster broomeanus]